MKITRHICGRVGHALNEFKFNEDEAVHTFDGEAWIGGLIQDLSGIWIAYHGQLMSPKCATSKILEFLNRLQLVWELRFRTGVVELGYFMVVVKYDNLEVGSLLNVLKLVVLPIGWFMIFKKLLDVIKRNMFWKSNCVTNRLVWLGMEFDHSI